MLCPLKVLGSDFFSLFGGKNRDKNVYQLGKKFLFVICRKNKQTNH